MIVSFFTVLLSLPVFVFFLFFFAKFCPPVSRQVLLLSNFPRTLNHPNRGMARCTAKYNEIIQERAVFFSRDTFLSVTFSYLENCHRHFNISREFF